MPRRAVIARRPLDPDPVYGSALVTQLVNKVLKDGKKSTSEAVVYGALERIRVNELTAKRGEQRRRGRIRGQQCRGDADSHPP